MLVSQQSPLKIQSPIKYIGSKVRLVKYLLPLFPPHRTYVEPFGGSGALLFAKTPGGVEVYNDINSEVVNLYRVLRDEEKSQKLQRLLALTPYSREEYLDCLNSQDENHDDVERARRCFVKFRQNIAGSFGWSYCVTKITKEEADVISSWLSAIDSLPIIHARLSRVQIEHLDFREVFRKYDTPQTFFYCDPPYIMSTRKARCYYAHEMGDDEHRELVQILLSIQGKALLSCYFHEIYRPLVDAGWHRRDFKVRSCAPVLSKKNGKSNENQEQNQKYRPERTETVLFNYTPPQPEITNHQE